MKSPTTAPCARTAHWWVPTRTIAGLVLLPTLGWRPRMTDQITYCEARSSFVCGRHVGRQLGRQKGGSRAAVGRGGELPFVWQPSAGGNKRTTTTPVTATVDCFKELTNAGIFVLLFVGDNKIIKWLYIHVEST